MPYDLDDTDKTLLNLLQEDARYSAVVLAEKIGVADNTIHHRINNLRDAGVITGFTATIDPDRTGLDLTYLFTCTVEIPDRKEVAAQLLEVPEVIEVIELMTGEPNLLVKIVGAEDDDITRVAEQLAELPIEIHDGSLIRAHHDSHLDFFELNGRLD